MFESKKEDSIPEVKLPAKKPNLGTGAGLKSSMFE
jgi:hypothetical protein